MYRDDLAAAQERIRQLEAELESARCGQPCSIEEGEKCPLAFNYFPWWRRWLRKLVGLPNCLGE